MKIRELRCFEFGTTVIQNIAQCLLPWDDWPPTKTFLGPQSTAAGHTDIGATNPGRVDIDGDFDTCQFGQFGQNISNTAGVAGRQVKDRAVCYFISIMNARDVGIAHVTHIEKVTPSLQVADLQRRLL